VGRGAGRGANPHPLPLSRRARGAMHPAPLRAPTEGWSGEGSDGHVIRFPRDLFFPGGRSANFLSSCVQLGAKSSSSCNQPGSAARRLHPTKTARINQSNRPPALGVVSFCRVRRGAFRPRVRAHRDENPPSFLPQDCSTQRLGQKNLESRQVGGAGRKPSPPAPRPKGEGSNAPLTPTLCGHRPKVGR